MGYYEKSEKRGTPSSGKPAFEKKRDYKADEHDRRWKKEDRFQVIQDETPESKLAEPPAPKPVIYCKLGCGRRAEYRISVLLYPAKPKAIGPTLEDRGARVVIGFTCKHHKKSWSVDTFLNTTDGFKAIALFRKDFDVAPYPPHCQLEIVRGLEVAGVST